MTEDKSCIQINWSKWSVYDLNMNKSDDGSEKSTLLTDTCSCLKHELNFVQFLIKQVWREEQTTDTVGVASGLGEAFIQQK